MRLSASSHLINKDMTKLTKEILEEFDQLWSGGLKKKYGEGFALYCNGCNGKNEEKFRSFLQEVVKRVERNCADKVRYYPTSFNGVPFMLPLGWQDEVADSLLSELNNKEE